MTVTREIKGLYYTYPSGWAVVDTGRAETRGVITVAKTNKTGYGDPWHGEGGARCPVGSKRLVYGKPSLV